MAKEAGEERTKLLVECEALRRKIAERNSQDEREEESLKGLLEENRVLREELEEANERVEELEGVVGRFREGVGVWLGILGRVGVVSLLFTFISVPAFGGRCLGLEWACLWRRLSEFRLTVLRIRGRKMRYRLRIGWMRGWRLGGRWRRFCGWTWIEILSV